MTDNEILVSLMPPDSTLIDSTTTDSYELGDTVFAYSDGADSVYQIIDSITDIDSLVTDSIILRLGNQKGIVTGSIHRNYSNLKTFTGLGPDIGIHFGGQSKNVNKGLFGINVTGMFDNATMPNEVNFEYGWDRISKLAPDVLRFPGGTYSRFTHLLHNTDGSASVGLGYDIYEIARYFDWTDRSMDVPSMDHILNDNEIELADWISDENQYIENFIHFRDKYLNQQCESHRYIDDFIDLVNYIDNNNPGKPAVKAIVCLNIMSETATECRAILDYLRAHDVVIGGVELGNETYDNFCCDVMGFHYFSNHLAASGDTFTGNYWDYINGGNYTNEAGEVGTTADDAFAHDELFNVLSTAMESTGAHDYISALKPANNVNYKVGLVGKPLGNDYAFKITEFDGAGCDITESWNQDLGAVYNAVISGTSKRKFDAVILHTYYSPDNWEDIVIASGQLDVVTTCDDTNPFTNDDPWHFGYYDSRLMPAFNGIIGVGGLPGNFKDFLIKSTPAFNCYEASISKFNTDLKFDLPATSPDKKELWTTEWNLKDNDNGLTSETDQLKVQVFSNSFVHGFLLFQWWLKDIKINFNTAYRPGFYTYSTIQSYAGGVPTDLSTPSDNEEREIMGIDYCPFVDPTPDVCTTLECEYSPDYFVRKYYTKRTPYFAAELFGYITKDNLKYLQSTFYISSVNINIQPTAFVNATNDTLFLYYSNVKSTTQNFILDPDNLIGLFSPAPIRVDLSAATITYLKASRLYSTAGKNALYNRKINTCYPDHDHSLELNDLIRNEPNSPDCTGTIDPANSCLSAPAYSFGYFKIPITAVFGKEAEEDAIRRKKIDFEIYPNPAESEFKIHVIGDLLINSDDQMDINIISLTGNSLLQVQATLTKPVNISALPVGCYLILCELPNGQIITKPLIKIY